MDSVAVSPPETATTPSQQTARGPLIVINGTWYFPESQPTLDMANLVTHDALLTPSDLFEYHAFVAVNDDIQTSVNWTEYSHVTNWQSTDTVPMALTSSSASNARVPALYPCELPFVLDTGATCHISLE